MFAKSISVEKELKNPPPNEFNQKPEFVSLQKILWLHLQSLECYLMYTHEMLKCGAEWASNTKIMIFFIL